MKNIFLSLAILMSIFSSFELTAKEIKILAWNIYQIPKPILWTNQGIRAKAVGEALKKSDYDLIFFEEAFSKSARKKIYTRIKDNYPFESGTFKKKKFGTILNSGLWAVSSHPLKVLEHIYFTNCKAADCFATKGAMLVEVSFGDKKIQVLGTHLQADNHNGREKIRNDQIKILKELLDKYQEDGVPQLIVGDLNVDYYSSEHYTDLLETLEAEDHELTGNYLYSTGDSINSYTTSKKRQELLDYILLRRNNIESHLTYKYKKLRQDYIIHKGKHLNLSDHYGVEALIDFPEDETSESLLNSL